MYIHLLLNYNNHHTIFPFWQLNCENAIQVLGLFSCYGICTYVNLTFPIITLLSIIDQYANITLTKEANVRTWLQP